MRNTIATAAGGVVGFGAIVFVVWARALYAAGAWPAVTKWCVTLGLLVGELLLYCASGVVAGLIAAALAKPAWRRRAGIGAAAASVVAFILVGILAYAPRIASVFGVLFFASPIVGALTGGLVGAVIYEKSVALLNRPRR